MTPIVTLNAVSIPNPDSDDRIPDLPKEHSSMTEHIGNRLIELTVEECQALLESSRIGRLGLVDADGPLILPVNYCMDGQSIVFRTHAGTKLDATSNGARVAFEVDGIDSAERTGWSILIRGSAATVTETEDLSRLEQLPLIPWAPGEKPHYVRISGILSGRRIALADLPSQWWG
jgi:hypothetical protein